MLKIHLEKLITRMIILCDPHTQWTWVHLFTNPSLTWLRVKSQKNFVAIYLIFLSLVCVKKCETEWEGWTIVQTI